MQKKNLIYILGGAAVIGYFIWMKKKQASEMPMEETVTPDQALAPSFVNQTTDVIKKVARTARDIKSRLKKGGAQQIQDSGFMQTTSSEPMFAETSPLSNVVQDMAPAQPLSAKQARQSAKSVKSEVRASGGTAKQARQAARVVRKEARQIRKVGELSVTF